MSIAKRIMTGLLIGLGLAFLFNSLLLNLLGRSLLDQILLVGFSTAAFGFIAFSWLGSREENNHLLQDWRMGKIWPGGAWIGPFLREHTPGLGLALIFMLMYGYLGSFFNSPQIATGDNFLDADNSEWVQRIAGPDGENLAMRAPHPFAFFIFRPIGWVANLFFRDPNRSATFLNAFAGGLSIFLAWVFIKTQSGHRTYALMIAALLGLSTSHFVFGSIVESYIFSAVALIGFFLLLLVRKESTGALIAISLVSFGITITNFVQTFIGFFVTRSRWREIFRFAGLAVSMGVILTLIHVVWYPFSKPFFLLSSTPGEERFVFSIFHEPSWKVIGRTILLIRTILLYSVIAPLPFALGGEFQPPSFQFFKISHGIYLYSEYNGLGNILVIAWAVALLIAGLSFSWKIVRTRKVDLSLAFALCLLFNFVLHLNYGDEPFLYSPDWTYALIFFISLGLGRFATNRFFQGILFVFLLFLAYNQWQFFKFVMDAVSAHLG